MGSLPGCSGRMISNFGGGAGTVDSISTPDCAMARPDPARARVRPTAIANVLGDMHLVSQIPEAQASETLGLPNLPETLNSGPRRPEGF